MIEMVDMLETRVRARSVIFWARVGVTRIRPIGRELISAVNIKSDSIGQGRGTKENRKGEKNKNQQRKKTKHDLVTWTRFDRKHQTFALSNIAGSVR